MTMRSKPAISVIIPNYNYAHYLGECIQSVIDQSFTDWEIIVVDDGSTDNSKEVVESFISKYPDRKIIYIYKEDGPSGTPAAVNLGIKNSHGKYIAWLSSDDVYMPTKLEVQFRCMEENPEIALTHTHFIIINEDGSVIGKGGSNYSDNYIVFDLLVRNRINGNTVLIRKDIFNKIGLFREDDSEYNNNFPEIWRAADREKWIEIAMKYKILLISQCLHKTRIHYENTQHYGINAKMADVMVRRIIEKFKIVDIFPFLKEFSGDQILYLSSLLELLFLCHQRAWFDLARKYLMKIQRELNEEICKDLPKKIEDLSYIELLKIISARKDLSSNMERFSEWIFQEGSSFIRKGDYAKGRKIFEDWLEIGTESIEIIYSLGSCYKKEGRFSEAIDKFQKVLSFNTDKEEIYYTGAHFHLGEIYQVHGRLNEARTEFEKCLRLNPHHKKAKEKLFTICQQTL